MGWLNGHRNGHDHSHIDPATGRNKRDNTRRGSRDQAPRRQNGKIVDRAASARKLKIERALRKKVR